MLGNTFMSDAMSSYFGCFKDAVPGFDKGCFRDAVPGFDKGCFRDAVPGFDKGCFKGSTSSITFMDPFTHTHFYSFIYSDPILGEVL